MIETVEEFLEQENIAKEVSMTLFCKKTKKWLHIKPEDFIDKYNKFLRKKSYLK